MNNIGDKKMLKGKNTHPGDLNQIKFSDPCYIRI